MSKVIISADSSCDIGPELQERFNIQLLNWKVLLDDKEYTDGVDIFPDDLFNTWYERKILPQTTAATPSDFYLHFKPLLEQGYEIVHIGLGSGISCSYQNCCLAAAELPGVYTVDSENLSTGFGQLVIKAAEMAEQGLPAPEIQERLNSMRRLVQTSFVVDTLDFLKAGGRCSSLVALGANLLKLKPCIEVENHNGSRMHVGKKYRGNLESCLRQYTQDKLAGRDDIDLSRLFIVHSGSPQSDIDAVLEEVNKLHNFKEINITRAGSVISTHCGPRTLGIMFMTL